MAEGQVMADTPDFISDSDMEAQAQPETPQSTSQPTAATFKPAFPEAKASPDFISDDDMAKTENTQTPTTQPVDTVNTPTNINAKDKASFEALARNLTFGGSDLLAKYLRQGAEAIGMNPDYAAPAPEEMAARQQAYPKDVMISNLIGTAMGVGALGKVLPTAGTIGKAIGLGEALPRGVAPVVAKPLLNYGLIAGAAIKGAIESGAIGGGDEISKSILGQPDGDPEATTSSVLSHIGINALLGGALSGGAETGLQAIAAQKKAIQSSKLLADFGNQWNYEETNPNPQEALHNELDHYYTSTKEAADDVYGVNGIKAQAIKKLVPGMHPGITDQNQQIANTLTSKLETMKAKPNSYPGGLVDRFENHVNDWMNTATNPNATSEEVFNATQDLKQEMQSYAKYDKQTKIIDPNYQFVNDAKDVAFQLRNHLENPNVWGKAAALQKGVNSAFNKFLPALSDFEKTFTQKVAGENVLDPGKTTTYVNQLGKANAEIKQIKMKNFIDAAENYRDEIAGIHQSLGVENSMQPSSLNLTKKTLGEITPGSKLATYVRNIGLPSLTDPLVTKLLAAKIGGAAGGVPGSIIGYAVGSPVSKFLQNVIGRPISGIANRYMMPATLKVLGSGSEDMSGLSKVLDYAQAAGKGAAQLDSAIGNVLGNAVKGATYKGLNTITDKDRDKLKDYIKDGTLNQGLQQEINKANTGNPPQAFAEGGEVSAKEPLQDSVPNPLEDANNPIAKHFPDQNMMLEATKGRVNGYLNSLRPDASPVPSLPFDTKHPNLELEKTYNNAIDMALNPLQILEHVKDGRLTIDNLKHFTSMYPDMYQHLNKKIMSQLAENQVNGEKPVPYKTRLSLSLFMGAPLDSTMKPQSIQAAQLTYLPAQSPQQPNTGQQKPKSGSPSKVNQKQAKSYQTTTQSAEADRSNRD